MDNARRSPGIERLLRRIRAAVKKTADLAALVRRNIQKSIALDALVVELRRLA